MQPFATYDFETPGSTPFVNPFVAALYSGDTLSTANNWTVIDRKPENSMEVVRDLLHEMRDAARLGIKTFWAHNGGKFDALFIVDALRQMPGWHCDGVTANGRIIVLRVTAPDVTFELKDSYAVIQSSLAKALESFAIPIQKTFTKEEYDRGLEHMSDKRLRDGCLVDCVALYKLIERAAEMAEGWGGELKSTFSSTALSLVKAHIGKPLPSHDGVQWANEISSKAYHGGRVEVYRHIPDKALCYYDICSSYPHSMTKALPWQLKGRAPPKLFQTDTASIVYATVHVPEQYLPPLPFVPPSQGLFFPTGEWSAWFTSAELEYAIENCGVTARLHEAIEYTVDTPFKSFIDTVYETKRTATGAKREFAKLTMNGCYGKFGQKPENTKLKVFATKEEATKWIHSTSVIATPMRPDDWTAVEIKTFRWPKHTHYAIAAFITAHSRIHLHQLARNAVYLCYADSDSIQARHTASLDNHVGSELGDLKVEVKEMRAEYYAPKLYRYAYVDDAGVSHTVYKSKGFPVSGDAFERIIKGELVGNPRGRMQGIKTQLRKGTGVIHLNEKETEKRWNGRSNKRRITGADTAPWDADALTEGEHIGQASPFAKGWPVTD